jgi:hypothetical protein
MMPIPVPELQHTVEMGQVVMEETGSTDGSPGVDLTLSVMTIVLSA